VEFGEVIAENLGRAAGVRVFGREQHVRIDDQTELYEVAIGAIEQLGWIARLLTRLFPDGIHPVDWRQVPQEENRLQARVLAYLATLDHYAVTCTGKS
jgi:hypothetical protein